LGGARRAHEGAALKLVVLFGGWNGQPLGDTWVWDGTNWAKGQFGPVSRCGPAMAYDATRQEIVMFGGDCVWGMDDTWTWNRTWTQRFPRSSPPLRFNAGVAYDAEHEQVVLFGGQGNRQESDFTRKDTWTWDGTTWHHHHSAVSRPGRKAMGMSYDAARQQVVFFGGDDLRGRRTDQTWTWDGVRWQRQFPAHTPSARDSVAMAYDDAAGKIVLFGGWNGRDLFGDTWTWDGSAWREG
jgi:hypothetical protein